MCQINQVPNIVDSYYINLLNPLCFPKVLLIFFLGQYIYLAKRDIFTKFVSLKQQPYFSLEVQYKMRLCCNFFHIVAYLLIHLVGVRQKPSMQFFHEKLNLFCSSKLCYQNWRFGNRDRLEGPILHHMFQFPLSLTRFTSTFPLPLPALLTSE